jgi:hypothetical protein
MELFRRAARSNGIRFAAGPQQPDIRRVACGRHQAGPYLHGKRFSEAHHGITSTTGAPWIGAVMGGSAPYDMVMATFKVPTAIPGTNGTTVTEASIWPGIGGFKTGSGLIQAGVVIQTTTTAASYLTWREYCCGDPDSNGYAGAFVPSPGDTILAQAWYCDANGQRSLSAGLGCTYLYDFQSGAVFSCTTPRGNGSSPACWSVQPLPLCSASRRTPNCMTLGRNAEYILENESGQISPSADQFPPSTSDDPGRLGRPWEFRTALPQGNTVGEYYRDNDEPQLRWHHLRDLGYPPNRFPRSVAFIQSNFKGDFFHGNFEAIVRVAEAGKPDTLDFWFLDSQTSQWKGPFGLLADGQQIAATGD